MVKNNKRSKYIIDLSDLKNFDKYDSSSLDEIARHMIEPVKLVQESIRRMAKIANDIIQANETFKNIGEYIKEYGKILDSFSYVMIEIDWPPPLDIDSRQMLAIIEYRKNNSLEETEKAVSEEFIKWYKNERIEVMFNSWIKKEWLKKRKLILKAVIDAHTKGQFLLSVPVMLTQVEGIIADGYGHIGWLGQERLKKYIEELCPENNTFLPDTVIRSILLNTILVKFEHGKKINSSLSRHAILHGADIDYGTKKNSLKALLLFNYLQTSFKLVNIKRSKVYHKIGCPRIIRSEQYKRVYRSEQKAKDDGKIPCKICIENKNSQA